MARDVKIWKDDGAFKLRVCGILRVDEKIMIANSCDLFWNFPGGHVQIGESTDDAVVREIFEEVGIKTKVKKLRAIIQLFFPRDDGQPFHEICYYYELTPESEILGKDFFTEEDDKGIIKKHEFRFVPLEDFDNIDIRPYELKEILEKDLENQHIIRNLK